ncbi:myrosinase 1-like [Danaus plexippus]|uniref:myrosinase 1-like n=1 Tax=Danaus plexippus TaxID=13037 RepID=UPI002AB0178F|nr:myrosinase 1-like [Danaus plexippus]
MSPLHTLVLLSFLGGLAGSDVEFPPNFKFGAATSSYQIEGGWNDDGKGPSVWDDYVHENRVKIKDNSNGDVAADSYHLWKEDIKITKELGLQFYRFSINWPRILPTGFSNKINKAGVKYYNELIDGLVSAGVEPVVTLYHWETPIIIHKLGGWTNPLIVKWFAHYARIVFSLFGDRVKTWITINEANVQCDYFYNSGIFITAKEDVFAPFLCNKHILMAHAHAYRIYEKEFKPKYGGSVSLANNFLWLDPYISNHEELAELGREHAIGRYSHPIYSKKGGWPPVLEKVLLEYSLKQGYKESRLPTFTKQEKEFVRGTADFYGVNYYTSNLIRPIKPGEDPGYFFITGVPELNAILVHPNNTWYGALDILPVYPLGLRRSLSWLKKSYGDIDILITECGFSTAGYDLNDYKRTNFYRDHLEQVLLSIKADNVSVIGFTAWSLEDNFEWTNGYNSKFGLYEVNFEDPKRSRTPRNSAHYYSCVAKNRSLNVTSSCIDSSYNSGDVWLAENGGKSLNSEIILTALNIILGYFLF